MAKTKGIAVSMKFEDMGEGGGAALPEGRYICTQSVVERSDYGQGKGGNEYTLLHLTLAPVDSKNKKVKDGETQEVFYSVGNRDWFMPSDDGTMVVAVSEEHTQISKTSNYGIFMKSLLDASFDDSDWEGDVTVLEGMVAVFRNDPAPDRDGLEDKGSVAGADPNKKKYKKLIAVVDELIVPPGGGEAPAPATGKKKTAKPVAEEEEEEEVVKPKGKKKDVAEEEEDEDEDGEDPQAVFEAAVATVLKGKKEEMERGQLRVLVFKEVKKHGGAEIAAKVNDLFVENEKALVKALKKVKWVVDGDEVSPA